MANIKTIEAGGVHADGVLIGLTGEKIGFAGATPVVQVVGAAQAAVTATSTNGVAAAAAADLAALAAEAEKIGDDARAAVVLVNALRAALVSLGLIKGAA
jgi:hypothetical protein